MKKLSASSISDYLRSPKKFYWRHVAGLVPAQVQVANFDHDLIFGRLWAEFTDNFYKGLGEQENTDKTMTAWLEKTDGWVPEKAKGKLTTALETLMPQYYQTFSPSDGVRTPTGSEQWIENDRFVSKLDGLSDDRIVHEVKTAPRVPSLSEQLWKVGHSIQVKLYCVLAEAQGYCIEFAYKDPPFQVFRGPVVYVTETQRKTWELELNKLADSIYALGDDPNNYPCHPDGCCLLTRGMVSMCTYQTLCEDGLTEMNKVFYKTRESRR